MRNIPYFILQCFSIIQPFDIGEIENSTLLEEINRDAFIIITNKTNEIEHSNESLVSGTTPDSMSPEPSRNSSTTSQKMVTHYHCRDSGECPYIKGHSPFFITDSARQVAGITFELYVLIFNIV